MSRQTKVHKGYFRIMESRINLFTMRGSHEDKPFFRNKTETLTYVRDILLMKLRRKLEVAHNQFFSMKLSHGQLTGSGESI